jgi:prepilin-type processing-associated H-X9-DG protein
VRSAPEGRKSISNRRGCLNQNNGVGCGLIFVVTIVIAINLFTMVRLGFRDPTGECASNLKQLGLAMLQYSQDNDDMLPPRRNASGRGGAVVSWRFLIYPYTKSRKVYQCPTNPSAKDKPERGYEREAASDDLSPSYAVNSTQSGAQRLGPFEEHSLAVRRVAQPSQTFSIVESNSDCDDFNILSPEKFAQRANTSSHVGNLFSGHDYGSRRETTHHSNYLYLDGHIHAWTPAWALTKGRPNPWTIDNAPFSKPDRQKAETVMAYSDQTYKNFRDKDELKKQTLIWKIWRIHRY